MILRTIVYIIPPRLGLLDCNDFMRSSDLIKLKKLLRKWISINGQTVPVRNANAAQPNPIAKA